MEEEKTKTIEGFLFGETREPLYLVETEGKIFPYKNRYVPKIFKKPLMISEKGEIEGWKSKAWKSGGRSALLRYRGRWYDIEGVRPSEKEWTSGIPEGGDTKKEAESELDVGDLFYRYGQENDVSALMKPICLFEYKTKFNGEPVCASVLETVGDLRLSHFLGKYLTVAGNALERLTNVPSREAKADCIINKVKDGLTDKIGQWVGFWYRCLDKNNLVWGTRYVENPDGTYDVYSNAGTNNIAAYRLKDGVAVGITDLDSCAPSEQKLKNLEIDRIKKRLSIFEMTLHILKHGRSGVNISQYQISQVYASRLYTQITPPRGINYFQEVLGYDPLQDFELPRLHELDIIKCFNEGRKGIKPQFIEERCVTNVDEMFSI